MSEFYQDGPHLRNQYDEDVVLRAYLQRCLPREHFHEIDPELRRLGERAAGDLLALDREAEANPPRHVPFDPWGRRVDLIETSDAWRALDRVAATEGLVATGYERVHGPLSRVDQFARLYLYSPSSATYSCPLAMTDGAARLLELSPDEVTRPVFERLTTRDPDRFWTAGQWMTERTGGSDVAATTTVALPTGDSGDSHRLYGVKWFTSATTSQVAMTLGRIEGAPAGSRGLSVFLLELRDADGALRGVRVNRLKDKLGTRALPTAELVLDGAPAHLVGGAGHGIRKISSLFNVTRVYNAMAAVAGMRRAVALTRDYAERRHAFGKLLAAHPLHAETLDAMELEWRAGFYLAFRVIELLGKQECAPSSESEAGLLRLLIPLAKLYTAKQAVAVASEALESFGGAGYVEDTGIPRLLRDAQVLPIWEGTTNILSLDVLRAIEKTDALAAYFEDANAQLARIRSRPLAESADRVREALRRIEAFAQRAAAQGRTFSETHARRFSYALARTYAAILLLEQADWETHGDTDSGACAAAQRWCARDLSPNGAEELLSVGQLPG